MQHGSPAGVSTGGTRAASGDAQASVVSRMVPMPVGIEIETDKFRRKKMKKFLVVLLSLGLIVAFSMTASAADVKFGGSYYVVGVFESNPGVADTYSHAFFYTRTRLQPVFTIAEGLTFTVRGDGLEKQWGNTNWKGGSDDLTSSRRNEYTTAAGKGQKIQESFEFERAYVTFKTAIGAFQVGYQNVDDWGTDYSDYSNSRPRAQYILPIGPVTVYATYEKLFENDTAGANGAAPTNINNADKDSYALSAVYKAAPIEAGLLYKYYDFNNTKPLGIKTTMNLLSPYVRATFGPVFIESELQYWFGKYAQYEAPITGRSDVDLQAYGAYLKAQLNLGPAYVGALYAYASGNDLSDDTKNTANPGGAGTNFAPALILMNDALATWTNSGSSPASPAGVTSSKYNVHVGNAFAGFNVTPKFLLEAALTYAVVDKKALSKTAGVVTEAIDGKLGTEVDVKATYKIYDNLSYMIGAGYLWTGDYFKGANANTKVENDYLLINQLTLSF